MSTPNKSRRGKEDKVLLSDYGMLPPNDKRMEDAVIGALLIDCNAYSRICEKLIPDCFYSKENRIVYEAIEELGKANQPIDFLSVLDLLQKKGSLEEIGGAFKVTNLTQSINTSAHIEYHAQIVYDKYVARQIITFCAESEKTAYQEAMPVNDMLQTIESELYKLSVNSTKRDFRNMSDMLMSTMKEIEMSANMQGLSGVPSGFDALDRLSGGWQKSDLIIVAARPAMGKTAFALSMAKNMIEKGHPAAIFSLEMSTEQLMKRLITNATGIPTNVIRSGKLDPMDWNILNNQVKELNTMKLFIDDSANTSIFELATKARRLVKEHGVECIFIDYLQLIHADGKTINNREQEVSTISRTLKQLAKELNIPIIALSQLNRGVESRTGDNKRPVLSDLRESGAIEQDADMVLLLHRPEYYGITEDEYNNSLIGMAEVIVAKNRNGGTGTVLLRFKGELMKFSDVDAQTIQSLVPSEPLKQETGPKQVVFSGLPSINEDEDADDWVQEFDREERKSDLPF